MPRSAEYEARNAIVRNGFSSAKEARAASPPTSETIVSTCQKLAVPYKTEDIPESRGAKLYWIGDTTPRDTILYFHGGGFGLPAIPGHIIFLVQTQQKLAAQGKAVSVAFLEYSLTPESKFPIQHAQGVQALNHIIQSGRKASDIIITGDSAGGNLALGVLSASKHARDGIPSLNLDASLKGAVLISPWTILTATGAAVQRNLDKDIVTLAIQDGLGADFVVGETDEFVEPLKSNSEWWKNTPVNSILCLVGTEEIFQDNVKSMAEILLGGGLKIELVECLEQVHIDCILDAQSEMEPGPMSLAIWDWLSKVL